MEYERYQRQLNLPNFGLEAQQKLENARVLVIGAGGLGCPALQYLVGAGVGRVGLIDFDTVSLSNLHRQVLYTVNDIGKPKVNCAKEALARLNPHIDIRAYAMRLDSQNALELFKSYDLIIDGSDNFSTRYLVSDVTEALSLPLIYGAVSKFEGQVAVFNVTDKQGKKVAYRDLFPHPPQNNEIENCAEGGVLGVLPGIIGTLQATEAIKILTGIGHPLCNQLLTYQALYNHFYTIQLQPDPTRSPIHLEAILPDTYEPACLQESSTQINAISLQEIEDLRRNPLKYRIIDVREYHEYPSIDTPELIQMPFSTLSTTLLEIDKEIALLITACASGKRSLLAANLLRSQSDRHIRYYQGSITDLFDL